MFKLCKKLIIRGLILFIGGIGVLGGLFASGTIDDLPDFSPYGSYSSHDEVAMTTLIEQVDYYDYNNAAEYTETGNILFQSSDASITDIDVSISSGTFSIIVGDEFKVTANNADVGEIYAAPDGDKLTIEYKRNFVDTLTYDPAEITLTVPQKTFEEISIEMDAGQMYIYGFTQTVFADKLDISLNAGNIETNSISVKEFALDMSAGNAFITTLNVSDSADISVSMGDCEFYLCRLANAKIDQSAGNMYFTDCTLTGDTKIDMSMGDMQFSGMIRDNTNIDMSAGEIYMSVTGFSSEYSVVTDRSAGTVIINGDEKTGRHTESVVDNSLGTINIDISAGDCEINFTEG